MPQPVVSANSTNMNLEEDKPKKSGKGKEYIVGIVTKETKEEVVVRFKKRDAEGKALPKQPKTGRMA